MEYTKEKLKQVIKNLSTQKGAMSFIGIERYFLPFVSAWEQEVAELEKDKEELRELCGLLNIASTGCASEKQDDRISELWVKHMEGDGRVNRVLKRYKGWAINANSKEGHGLLGRYYFLRKPPEHMEGHVCALFETRKQAKRYIEQTKRSFPNSKVERVEVTVTKVY